MIERMTRCGLSEVEAICPLPDSEDRLMEAFHIATRLEDEYHDPRAFRYNLNSLLSSIGSLRELLQKEIERLGVVTTWNETRQPFMADPALNALWKCRNITLHQRAIFDGSQAEIGLFRWRRHKLSIGAQIPGDIHSRLLLEQWTNSDAGKLFLDPDHSATGEEYGVWRRYFIPELSAKDDVLLVVRRGLMRSHDMVAAAHELLGVRASALDDEAHTSTASLAETSVLLESDVRPDLLQQWGWT